MNVTAVKLKASIFFFFLLVFIAAGWGYLHSKASITQTHFHAGFRLYEGGVMKDFSDLSYMHIDSCTQKKVSLPLTPIDRVHLHDGIGDVAHIHAPGVTWGELFQNLHTPLTATAAGLVNGQSVDNIGSYPIAPYDSVLIFNDGVIDRSKTQTAVTREHMKEAEALVESCGQ